MEPWRLQNFNRNVNNYSHVVILPQRPGIMSLVTGVANFCFALRTSEWPRRFGSLNAASSPSHSSHSMSVGQYAT